MILGIGVDLVNIQRIASVCKRHERHFVQRILTESEQERFDGYTGARKMEYLSGRFAMKEAVAKALDTGIGSVSGWRDIETVQLEEGRSIVRLSPRLQESLADRLDTVFSSKSALNQERFRIHISLSHEQQLVIAQAVVEVV